MISYSKGKKVIITAIISLLVALFSFSLATFASKLEFSPSPKPTVTAATEEYVFGNHTNGAFKYDPATNQINPLKIYDPEDPDNQPYPIKAVDSDNCDTLISIIKKYGYDCDFVWGSSQYADHPRAKRLSIFTEEGLCYLSHYTNDKCDNSRKYSNYNYINVFIEKDINMNLRNHSDTNSAISPKYNKYFYPIVSNDAIQGKVCIHGFDGQGHKISNLTIDNKEFNNVLSFDYIGFFSVINNGIIIKNIYFDDPQININTTSLVYGVGILAGRVGPGSIIDNVMVKADRRRYTKPDEYYMLFKYPYDNFSIHVNTTGFSNNQKAIAVGGLIGMAAGETPNNSYKDSDGIYHFNTIQIYNCAVFANILAEKDVRTTMLGVGGIVGRSGVTWSEYELAIKQGNSDNVSNPGLTIGSCYYVGNLYAQSNKNGSWWTYDEYLSVCGILGFSYGAAFRNVNIYDCMSSIESILAKTALEKGEHNPGNKIATHPISSFSNFDWGNNDLINHYTIKKGYFSKSVIDTESTAAHEVKDYRLFIDGLTRDTIEKLDSSYNNYHKPVKSQNSDNNGDCLTATNIVYLDKHGVSSHNYDDYSLDTGSLFEQLDPIYRAGINFGGGTYLPDGNGNSQELVGNYNSNYTLLQNQDVWHYPKTTDINDGYPILHMFIKHFEHYKNNEYVPDIQTYKITIKNATSENTSVKCIAESTNDSPKGLLDYCLTLQDDEGNKIVFKDRNPLTTTDLINAGSYLNSADYSTAGYFLEVLPDSFEIDYSNKSLRLIKREYDENNELILTYFDYGIEAEPKVKNGWDCYWEINKDNKTITAVFIEETFLQYSVKFIGERPKEPDVKLLCVYQNNKASEWSATTSVEYTWKSAANAQLVFDNFSGEINDFKKVDKKAEDTFNASNLPNVYEQFKHGDEYQTERNYLPYIRSDDSNKYEFKYWKFEDSTGKLQIIKINDSVNREIMLPTGCNKLYAVFDFKFAPITIDEGYYINNKFETTNVNNVVEFNSVTKITTYCKEININRDSNSIEFAEIFDINDKEIKTYTYNVDNKPGFSFSHFQLAVSFENEDGISIRDCTNYTNIKITYEHVVDFSYVDDDDDNTYLYTGLIWNIQGKTNINNEYWTYLISGPDFSFEGIRVVYEPINYSLDFTKCDVLQNVEDENYITQTFNYNVLSNNVNLINEKFENENVTIDCSEDKYGNKFSSFIFHYDTENFYNNVLQAKRIEFDVSDDSVGQIVTIYNDKTSIKLGYSKVVTIGKDKYYYVKSILSGSYGSFTFNNSDYSPGAWSDENYLSYPFTSKYSDMFDVVIDMPVENNIFTGLPSVYTASDYYGVCGGDNYNNEASSTDSQTQFTLKVHDSDNYRYPFMSSYLNSGNQFVDSTFPYISKGLSFNKLSNFSASTYAKNKSGGYYYLTNYGHEIIGWKVKIGDQYLTLKKYSDDFCELILTSNENYIPCEYLVDDNFEGITVAVAYADWSGAQSITLTPIWKAVDINVYYKPENNPEMSIGSTTFNGGTTSADGTIAYNTSYSLNAQSQNGKTQIYYTKDDKVISLCGVWNYLGLTKDDYTIHNNKYKIVLDGAVFTDNIYKVELTNVYSDGNKITFDSENLDYSLAEFSGFEDEYTYNDFGMQQYSSGWIDNYITKLKQFKEDYQTLVGYSYPNTPEWLDLNLIEDDQLSLLRKVFVENGSISENEITGENVKLYIYLANNQKYGNLPVFNKPYHQLIMWEKDGNAYKTQLFNTAEHGSVEQGSLYSFKDVWTLESEGSTDGEETTNSCSINAYYFRKYFNLKINTLLDEKLGQYGYVKFTVTDDIEHANDAEYLVIYNNGKMSYYKIENDNLLKDLFNVNGNNLSNNSNLTPIEDGFIKVYSGSNIAYEIFDQSQDAVSMATGKFDSMIGLRYSKTTLGFDVEEETPTENLNYSFNQNYNLTYPSGTNLIVDVEFTKIPYDIVFVMENGEHGNFKYQHKGVTSLQYDRKQLNDITVGDVYFLEYQALIGYEFDDIAFSIIKGYKKTTDPNVVANKNYYTYNGSQYELVENPITENINSYFEEFSTEITLKPYYKPTTDTAIAENKSYFIKNGDVYQKVDTPIVENIANYYEIDLNQTYIFKLDGTWLRENYYTYFDTAYSVNDAELGDLSINTKEIEFDYLVKVYDTVNKTYLEDKYMQKVRVNENITLTNAFTKYEDMYIYQDETGNYAVISSAVYRIKYPSNRSYYSKQYNFVLTERPNEEYLISSEILSNMLNNQSNKIVPLDNRKIYMILDVAKLFKIDAEIVVDEHDADGEKTSEIFNSSTNRIVLDTANETKSIYTYQGLNNVINSNFDSRYYSSVEYYIVEGEGETATEQKLDSNNFKVDKDVKLKIKYITKPLELKIKCYEVTGETEKTYTETTFDNTIIDLTVENSLEELNNIFIGSEINLNYTFNKKYNLTIEVLNKSPYDLTGTILSQNINEDGSYNSSYTAESSNYLYDGLCINVYLEMLPNEDIQIMFAYADSNKSTGEKLENCGQFEISITDNQDITNNVDINQNNQTIKVFEGDRVVLNCGLNTGYYYVGYKYNHNDKNYTPLDANGNIQLISNFSKDLNAGIYTIYIDKYLVDVEFNLDSEDEKIYSISSENCITEVNSSRDNFVINDLYVGKEIVIKTNQTLTEGVEYFYYLDNGGNKVSLEMIELDNLNKKFTITSEILQNITFDETTKQYKLNLGVETYNKYKLDFVYTGEEFLNEENSTLTNNEEVVTLKDYKTTYYKNETSLQLNVLTILENKYLITIKDNNNNTIYSNEYRVENHTLTITEDTIYYITIVPKTMQITVEEYEYKELDKLENLNPTLTENEVNAFTVDSTKYLDKTNIGLNVVAEDRVLNNLTFTYVDDVTNLEILQFNLEINSGSIQISSEDEFEFVNNKLIFDSFNLELQIDVKDGRLIMSYISQTDIKIEVVYTVYKNISQI